ncbi:reverse transcriptase/maturase family protein [Nonomuraea zeae]|nr:reverse transcriptase/maturase family protein [Nonomuraea zeae]
MEQTWTGTVWFIEGDIADCFGSLDHDIMIKVLAEKIHDGRFLRLIRNMLTAGYLQDWTWRATHSGAPQGGVASPVLSNIYLHKLDQFVETVLIPQHTKGVSRRPNPAYEETRHPLRQAQRRGDRTTVRELRRQRRRLPSRDPHDPGYRRLRYSRYTDDHLLGFIGPKAEAEDIKDQLATFLREELNREMSPSKTLITHARTRAARFLGYEIITQDNNTRLTNGRRSVNGIIALRVPLDVIKTKCGPYLRHGKPWHISAMQNLDDYDIVKTCGAQYRGIVQYYLLAIDVWRLHPPYWIAQTSMLKTLAAKHQSSVSKMAAKHRAKIQTPYGIRTCFEARVERDGKQPLVARFGGMPLARNKDAKLDDRVLTPRPHPRKELVTRLLKRRCELCGDPAKVLVHQVRKLAQLDGLGTDQPAWAALMTRMRRKTLVVCHPCHEAIHHRHPVANVA